MYEHKKDKLASKSVFYRRVWTNLVFTCIILFICLSIGILGYHYSAQIGWLDSMHNASMILSGMGPVVEIKTDAGKWFSSFYALFSGVAFITNISLLLAPIAHRFFHKLHLEDK
jgi:ABC-type polysaccharide/polyol phosphate export permease